jgi:gamma-glutamyltranspeptidase/glutathione hydrolase
VQILVGGAGAGLVAVDGRVRQPGLGIPRPRGTLSGAEVPGSARVGVPALPAALAAVLASVGSATLTRASAPAVEAARGQSPERAAVLRSFGRRGPSVMASESVAGELVAIAGRAAGGALTAEDLSAVRPEVVPCAERRLAPGGVLRVPWEGASVDGQTTQVVAATDRRGLVAIACYELAVEGLAVPALGLLAPAVASPVMRGETRLRPGEPLPAPAPIALRARKGLVELALGVSGAPGAEAALVALLGKLSDETPLVAEMLAGVRGHPVALVRTREAARVVVSAG